MGLIVNKPSKEMKFSELLDQLSITPTVEVDGMNIHYGGPVEMARGFVLHSSDYNRDGVTLKIDDRMGMTATLDVIKDIAKGDGPEKAVLALGYAGWAPHQLEGELQQNGWLTCPSDNAIIFEIENDKKWASALNSMGIDPLLLSAEGGSA